MRRTRPARAWAGAPLAALALACTPAVHRTRPLPALEARYAAGILEGAPATATATRAYRGILARSLAARCRMLPSDSELFDRRARRCGATTAAVLGIARVMLEVEAAPEVLPSLVAGGRVRWLDLPAAEDCGP
jgi:hypothetical protein